MILYFTGTGNSLAVSEKIAVATDNSAVIFGRNPNEQLWKIDKYASRMDRIVADVKARRRGSHFGAPGLAGAVAGLPAVERKLLGGFKPAVEGGRCVGCGRCVKVCPVGNISLNDSRKAVIGPDCSACVGCLHACPQQAVTVGGKPTPKERQYHYPSIKNS